MAAIDKVEGAWRWVLAIGKIVGVILVAVVLGKLIFNWGGTKLQVKTIIKSIKIRNWRRSKDDAPHPRVKDPLTDEELDDMENKL